MSTPRTPTTHLRRRLTWTSGTVDLILGQAERIGRNMADLLPTVGSGGGGESSCRAPHEVDPTGDAVAAQVRADAWRAEELAEEMARGAAELLRIFQRYDRAPGDHDDVAVDLEELNRPKCQICLRAGFLANAHRTAPTRVRYRGQPTLDAELWLCRWCEDRIRGAASTGARGRLAIPAPNLVKFHARKVGLQPSDHVVAEAGDASDVAEYAGISYSSG